MAMNCPNCGARMLDGASFCERCGMQIGIPPFKSTQLRPQPPKDNKVLWIVAVVVIVVVVVPIVLSAVLYFMVLGFDGTTTQTPTSSLTKSAVTGGNKFTFAPMSMDTPWSDVTVLLSDGYSVVAWSPQIDTLYGGGTIVWVGGSQMLGTLDVFANVTDLAGNGYVNQGDYFTFTLGSGQSFSPATTYTVTIMHDPSSASICQTSFQGEAEVTPISSLTKSTIINGDKFTFAPMSRNTSWSDVSILLTDGLNTATWSPLTTDLDNGTVAKWNHVVTTANLGTLKVNISIIDLAGNGYINQGDYFTLTLGTGQAFSTATAYTVTIMHDPTSAEICHISFQG
jgi:zinc-ribbon domain